MAEPVRLPLTPVGQTVAGTAPTLEQLYATPDELYAVFGVTVTEPQIRLAQGLINGHCGRRSLFLEEYCKPWCQVPYDRQTIHLEVLPVVQITSAQGRYGYGRRDKRALVQSNVDYPGVIAILGSPPRFVEIDVNQIQFEPNTGVCWLPTGFFIIGFTEIEIRYIAGYPTIPFQLKLALVEVINEVCTRQSSSLQQHSVGRVSSRYSGDTFVSQQAQALLEPFVVRSYA